MENVKLTINGKEITAPAGSTILETEFIFLPFAMMKQLKFTVLADFVL